MHRILIVLALGAFSLAANAERADLKLIGSQGTNYFFTLSEPWILDSTYVERVGRNFCNTVGPLCAAHFWKTGTPAARSLPMTDAQIAAEMATFQGDRMLWRCGAYKIANPRNCFSN